MNFSDNAIHWIVAIGIFLIIRYYCIQYYPFHTFVILATQKIMRRKINKWTVWSTLFTIYIFCLSFCWFLLLFTFQLIQDRWSSMTEHLVALSVVLYILGHCAMLFVLTLRIDIIFRETTFAYSPCVIILYITVVTFYVFSLVMFASEYYLKIVDFRIGTSLCAITDGLLVPLDDIIYQKS